MPDVISVLLPFRDSAATLREALESVLAERDLPLEIIAIDDGSRDDGADIVRRLEDPRVHLVRTGGLGIPGALALGLSHARGEHIARMDADDVSLPGRFAAQLACMRDAAVVGTQVEAFPEVGFGLTRYVEWMNGLLTAEDHAREIFVEAPLCHPSVMMRRDALEEVGGWLETEGPEDYDLWLRFHAQGHAMIKVPRVLLRWRHHPARATLTDSRYALERFPHAKAPYLARFIAGRPFLVWGAGRTGKNLARALEAHGAHPTAFVDIDPKKIGGVARGVPIVAPDFARGPLVLVAVGARGARDEVRGRLGKRGFVEGVDFVCAS